MSSNDTSNNLAQHLETARRILNRIYSWWSFAEQVRGGVGKIPPVATLVLPDKVWDDLTKKQQISLTFYAENMVDNIRNTPEKYLTISPSAPIYSSILANYRCINDGFWEIIIGRFDENSRNLMVDKSIVRGDQYWDYEQVKLGSRASDFRETKQEISHLSIIPYAKNAVVDIRKLRDYCLDPNHDDGKHKARLFSSILGMTADDAEDLRQIILKIVRTQEAKIGRKDTYGQRYTIDFTLEWKNRSASVRSGWIIENNSDIPKLTTCYPL